MATQPVPRPLETASPSVPVPRLKAPDTRKVITSVLPTRLAATHRVPGRPSLHTAADTARPVAAHAPKPGARTTTAEPVEAKFIEAEAEETGSHRPATAPAVAAAAAALVHDERGVVVLLITRLRPQTGALTGPAMTSQFGGRRPLKPGRPGSPQPEMATQVGGAVPSRVIAREAQAGSRARGEMVPLLGEVKMGRFPEGGRGRGPTTARP